MKKYILSFLVIATSAVYIVYQKVNGLGDSLLASSVSSSQSTDTLPASVPVVTAKVSPVVVKPKPKPVPTPVPVKITTPTPVPTPAPIPAPVPVASAGQYKDGQYTGVSANAFYGNIQVLAIISGGKLTDVQFLDYPQDRSRSISINTQAMPLLKQEAIQAQSANVNGVSGATDSSGAFRQSLSSALAQAANS
jgi:uncharacterized protein with FMN-binding domain